MDFAFQKHVPWDCPDIILKKFSKRGRTKANVPPIFWALNANCSNTVKVTDFKFDKRVSRETPVITRLKYSVKGVRPGMHDPLLFCLGGKY